VRIAGGSAALVLTGITLVATEVAFDWLPVIGLDLPAARDPDIEAVDWRSLRAPLASYGLPVAALNWRDAGKIAYALDGAAPVLCLNTDQRQWGYDDPAERYVGRVVLIVARPRDMRGFDGVLAGVEPLQPVVVLHAGDPALTFSVFRARLIAWPPQSETRGRAR
jgi:hypothetical protein